MRKKAKRKAKRSKRKKRLTTTDVVELMLLRRLADIEFENVMQRGEKAHA